MSKQQFILKYTYPKVQQRQQFKRLSRPRLGYYHDRPMVVNTAVRFINDNLSEIEDFRLKIKQLSMEQPNLTHQNLYDLIADDEFEELMGQDEENNESTVNDDHSTSSRKVDLANQQQLQQVQNDRVCSIEQNSIKVSSSFLATEEAANQFQVAKSIADINSNNQISQQPNLYPEDPDVINYQARTEQNSPSKLDKAPEQLQPLAKAGD